MNRIKNLNPAFWTKKLVAVAFLFSFLIVSGHFAALNGQTRGCGLGVVWDEYEVSGWNGTWTRRGTSSTFDAVYKLSGYNDIFAVLNISISGNSVSVSRSESWGGGCRYVGKISSDGVSVSGTYNCDDPRGGKTPTYSWNATIRCPNSTGRSSRDQFVGTWDGITGDGRFREVWNITENSGRWSVSGAFYDKQNGQKTGGFYVENVRFQGGVLAFRMILAPKPHSSWTDSVEFSGVTVSGDTLTSRHEYGSGTFTRRK